MNKRHIQQYTAAILSSLTFAVYLAALRNDFVNWDDDLYLYNNPNIRSLDWQFLRWAFTTFYASNWHPFTWITHAVDYALWGLNPLGHHLTSIVLHALNTGLVVVLVLRLAGLWRERAAAAGAPPFPDEQSVLIAAGTTGLLFGLHPLHVESVAWVAERKDVLCGLFFLMSIIAYTDHVRVLGENPVTGGRGASPFFRRPYLVSLGCFVLALMSKPMALSLPLVLLVLDWHPFGRLISWRALRGAIIEKLPFLVLSAASAFLTIMAQSSGDAMKMLAAVPLWARLLVAAKALVAYLGMMALPVGLSPSYPYPGKAELMQSLPLYLGAAGVVIGITVAVFLIAGRRRLWMTVWVYYVITLMPVIGIVQVGLQPMADRYAYLPSLGPFAAAGVVSAWGRGLIPSGKYRWLAAGGLAAAVVILSLLTIRQVSIWKNDVDLWTHVLRQEPVRVPIAYANRGLAFESLGDLDRALEDLDRAIALRPASYILDVAQYNRDRIADEKDQIDRAVTDFQRAIAKDAADAGAYRRLGIVFGRTGQHGRALENLNRAIELDPRDDDAYVARGLISIKREQYDRAVADFDIAISLNADSVDAYLNRGVAYERQKKLDDALADYDRAIALDPADSLAHGNRGIVLGKMGRLDRAIEDYTKAIALNPDFIEAYIERAGLYLKTGSTDLATKDYQNACDRGSEEGCRVLHALERGQRAGRAASGVIPPDRHRQREP